MSESIANIIGILIMIISFWICYGAGWYLMPEHPFAEWYGLPLMVTLMFTWMWSCVFAASVTDKLEGVKQ